jgi:pimeloyl-ACP methyl ester carboxylesterase
VGAEPVDLGIDEMDAAEKAWTARLAAKLAVPLAVEAAVEAVPAPARDQLERVPLPWPVKERLMKKLLRDVHHYLFNVEQSPRPGATYRVQDEIRGRMIRTLTEGAARPGPHIVVSHSMGTVIAYDCLKRVPDAPAVAGLMTIGSPLGLDEIQDKLKPEWSRAGGFPHERVRGGWVNVFDRLDPVAGFDPSLANDYRKSGEPVVDDVNEQNHGTWRHDIGKYLGGAQLRGKLRGLLGLD